MRYRWRVSALAHKSLTDIVRRPIRSLLVTLGIVTGVAGLTAINVANDALHRALAYTANETQAANITLFAQRIDPAVLPQLQAMPNVVAVQLSTQEVTHWHIAAAPGHVSVTITAYRDPHHVSVNPFQVTQGHLPGLGEIVMDASDSIYQRVGIGDTVTVDTPHGPMGLHVVGLSRTLGFFSAAFTGSTQAYMSPAGLAQLSGITEPNVVDVRVRDVAYLDQTAHALYEMLQRQHIPVQSYTTDATPFGTEIVDGFFTIIRVLSLVALVLTALLIINSMTTLIAEQTAIIGTMKALGGRRATIMRGYLYSVLGYASMGILVGMVLGVVGGYLLTQLLTSLITLDLGPFQLAGWVVLVSLLVGMGVPLIAALPPLWIGTSVTIQAAMSTYGISIGTGRLRTTGQTTTRFVWIPQTVWVGLHGLMRKRGRAAFTLLALTLAGAIFVAAQTTAYAVNQRQAQIDTLYPWDVQITLNSPQPILTVQEDLTSTANVAIVEAQRLARVHTSWGTLVLQGFAANTRLYKHPILTGRWLSNADQHALVLSDTAARKAHLQVGDTLPLTVPAGSQTWTVMGIAHDPSASPQDIGTGFVTLQEFASFTQQPADTTTIVLLQAHDRLPAAVNTLATTVDQRLGAAGIVADVVTHQQDDQMTQMQSQLLAVLLDAVAGIVGIAGALALANTLTTSVLEQRREIGIMRSLGATGRRVATVFWVESLALALTAWGGAAIIGLPIAAGFLALISAVLLPIDFAFSTLPFAWMLVFILISATIASVGPAFGAARIRIATILRYE